MKKAKEYFEEMKIAFDSKDEEIMKAATVRIFKEFFNKEIPELIESRNAKSDSAMKAIFREQNQKWNSLCDKCEAYGWNVLLRDAIKQIVEEKVLHGSLL